MGWLEEAMGRYQQMQQMQPPQQYPGGGEPMATAGMGMNEMTGQRIPQLGSSLSTGLKMGAPARSGGFGI